MGRTKCQFIKLGGAPCQAFAQASQNFCFRHDLSKADLAIEASRKGGQNRQLKGSYGQAVKIDSPEDIKKLLGQVINAVWTGQAPVAVGGSMGFLARCWLDAYEALDIAKSIEGIEKKLGSSKFDK